MSVISKQLLSLHWQQAGRLWDGVPAGYYVARRPDGVEVAQARCSYVDGTGEHQLQSDIYELVREADQAPTPSVLDTSRPVSVRDAFSPDALAERVAKATEARIRMKPNQRSPLDMEKIARELQNDGAYKEHAWQLEVQRNAQRKADSDQAVAFLLQLDPEFLTDEQCAQLGKVLAHIAERGKS